MHICKSITKITITTLKLTQTAITPAPVVLKALLNLLKLNGNTNEWPVLKVHIHFFIAR